MKVSGKGIIVIVFFLVLIPVLLDIFFASFFPGTKIFDFSMAKSLIGGYIKLIPRYIGYLIVAFTVLYLINNEWKKRGDKNNRNDEIVPNSEQDAEVSDTTKV